MLLPLLCMVFLYVAAVMVLITHATALVLAHPGLLG